MDGDKDFKMLQLHAGEGYFEWAEQMHYVLMHKGRKVWLAVQGMYMHFAKPESESRNAQDAHIHTLDEWEDANMAVLALIGSCVVLHLHHLLCSEESVHNAWTVLKMHFQEGLVQHIEQLQAVLRDVCQLHSTDSYDKFVSEIQTIADKLAAVGVTVSTLPKITVLIRGACKELLPWTAALQLDLDKHTMEHALGEETKDDAIFDHTVHVLQVALP